MPNYIGIILFFIMLSYNFKIYTFWKYFISVVVVSEYPMKTFALYQIFYNFLYKKRRSTLLLTDKVKSSFLEMQLYSYLPLCFSFLFCCFNSNWNSFSSSFCSRVRIFLINLFSSCRSFNAC